jgi:G3E family GTPase
MIKMIKVDIFSGFLGAGKTTIIKKLVSEAYKGEKVVLIENEFGEIGIDGGFLKDAGIEINEMNSGCICCSLVGDFGKALRQVIDEFKPERILIEPSGVGKLSDIIEAVKNLHIEEVKLNGFTTIVDAGKAKIYMKNFGEFFNNQVEHASSIILSHTSKLSEEKMKQVVDLLKEHNPHAVIITTEWDKLSGKQVLAAIENKDTLQEALHHLEEEHCHEHHHEHDHHEHHDYEEHCCCGHEHHDHEEHCCCGHDHDHHHHHADEVFDSIGEETTKKYTVENIEQALKSLEDQHSYGFVLRAKGIVEAEDGSWIHFDYVPGEPDVRLGGAEVTGRLCVIGSELNHEAIHKLFDL